MGTGSLGGTGGLTLSRFPGAGAEELRFDRFEAIELDREVGLEILGGVGNTKPGGKGHKGAVGVFGALLHLDLVWVNSSLFRSAGLDRVGVADRRPLCGQAVAGCARGCWSSCEVKLSPATEAWLLLNRSSPPLS